jgi:hypothetical protein
VLIESFVGQRAQTDRGRWRLGNDIRPCRRSRSLQHSSNNVITNV